MAVAKTLGMPLIEGLPTSAEELPSIITFMVLYRSKIESFYELPKDKRPPRDLWDKPFKLGEFLDEIWETDENKKGKNFIQYNSEEVE